MTWQLTVTCDGHRPDGPCRGTLHCASSVKQVAQAEALRAGWRRTEADGTALCPSSGHLEEE